MQDQSLVPHPVDVVESDLAESRKLLARCLSGATDPERPDERQLEYIGAATRRARRTPACATCSTGRKPPNSVRRKRRPGESAESGWGYDDRQARYFAEREAEKILKTTPDDSSEENSKTTPEPNIRFV